MRLDAETLPDLARGCAILGTGGGGDPYVGLLMSLQAVEERGPVGVVDLDDLDGDDLVMPCGMIGAPTVSIEKFGTAEEGASLRHAVEAEWGRPVAALMAAEIGGSNGVLPAFWAAHLGLPVVDADGMGRAFPEVPQVTMELAGVPAAPVAMADERGNALLMRPVDGTWAERMARTLAVEWGGRGASSEYQMSAARARGATVRGSVSLAVRIGRALREEQDDPMAALARVLDLRVLIAGKVVDVERRTTGGFVRGSALIEGLGDERGRELRLEIQNENLVALEGGRVLASVPDLITVLDAHTGEAVSTERLRYGQRVRACAFPCDPVWRTPAGLARAGPRAFGYDFDYVPLEAAA
jgi:uncharacterized protein